MWIPVLLTGEGAGQIATLSKRSCPGYSPDDALSPRDGRTRAGPV